MNCESLKDDRETDDGLFQKLPDELIHHIYSFFDIGSLGSMAQVNSGVLSTYACNDATWTSLVYRRFNINTSKTRSKIHGGSTWKGAFRSMSFCNRAPKCRYTAARKVVFAKCGGGKECEPVSAWVLLSHTANCETRRWGPYVTTRASNRFVELHVCLQNVKSSSGPITVDILNSTLDLMGSCDRQHVQGWPRILHRSEPEIAPLNAQLHDGLVLKPFEFCIIAMRFSCESDVFETDVLARALALRVPVRSSDDMIKANFLPESDFWDYYMKLPGGFLSLCEKNTLVSV